MAISLYPIYEIDLTIRRLDDMSGADDPRVEGLPRNIQVTQEMKHLKLGWKEALKILFDKFI